jgi:hypothetical protein
MRREEAGVFISAPDVNLHYASHPHMYFGHDSLGYNANGPAALHIYCDMITSMIDRMRSIMHALVTGGACSIVSEVVDGRIETDRKGW